MLQRDFDSIVHSMLDLGYFSDTRKQSSLWMHTPSWIPVELNSQKNRIIAYLLDIYARGYALILSKKNMHETAEFYLEKTDFIEFLEKFFAIEGTVKKTPKKNLRSAQKVFGVDKDIDHDMVQRLMDIAGSQHLPATKKMRLVDNSGCTYVQITDK